MSKASLKTFLAQNPFPRPLTQGFFYREKMRAIHTITPKIEYSKVLEVGGGESGLSAMLFPMAQITNIDFEPRYADSACNQRSRVNFICGDATALPFPDAGADDGFDAITLFDLLEHVSDHQAAIAEALRVLKPGGYLLVSTPNEHWQYPYYSVMQPICPPEQHLMDEWGHVRRGYTLAELTDLIQLSCRKWMTFINPLTVLCHDIAFSKLSVRQRELACIGLSPLTWLSYWLHQPHAQGTETASAWQKPPISQ